MPVMVLPEIVPVELDAWKPFWALIVWAPPPVMVTPVTLRSALLKTVAFFWKSLIEPPVMVKANQGVVVDDEADAALNAADHRLAAGGGTARIGIAHAGDVDVEQAARGVAEEDAVEIRLARAAAFVDRVAAAVTVDVDLVDHDVGADSHRDDGIDFPVRR